eukprot:CAMPEP_0181289070 /NCGR_PEP_ID=MMETSP1101-20121128/685_1 /TAXON_ID=46948 /ORGANISM="Rhodomonas abbreviata, Strain Caron Lab Isolate" /LENGTH=309 /DNA_ID=CAMNT_0023393265 /DNA_START=122 /DNA_END=1051 /DNA_ORIENTATION=+
MCGKVALVTGGTSGVGLETCERLVRSGVRVFLACRDKERGQQVVNRLKALAPKGYEEASAAFAHCDLADLSSVVTFARTFTEKNLPLNILLLNAGMVPPSSQKSPNITVDGFEECFQSNHLGHFLLTRLLTPSLKETSGSRVLVVSSSLHKGRGPKGQYEASCIKLDSMDELRKDWVEMCGGMQLYGKSKLYNILFANELHRRLKSFGVTANSLSPGWIPNTNLSRNQGFAACLLMKYVVPYFPISNIATVDEAGECIEWLALSPEMKGVGGNYYSYCKPVPASSLATDEVLAAKLWALSEKAVQGLHL